MPRALRYAAAIVQSGPDGLCSVSLDNNMCTQKSTQENKRSKGASFSNKGDDDIPVVDIYLLQPGTTGILRSCTSIDAI